jgi:hypothetical protein
MREGVGVASCPRSRLFPSPPGRAARCKGRICRSSAGATPTLFVRLERLDMEGLQRRRADSRDGEGVYMSTCIRRRNVCAGRAHSPGGLHSRPVTWPAFSASVRATRPGPQATSSTRSPGRTWAASLIRSRMSVSERVVCSEANGPAWWMSSVGILAASDKSQDMSLVQQGRSPFPARIGQSTQWRRESEGRGRRDAGSGWLTHVSKRGTGATLAATGGNSCSNSMADFCKS